MLHSGFVFQMHGIIPMLWVLGMREFSASSGILANGATAVMSSVLFPCHGMSMFSPDFHSHVLSFLVSVGCSKCCQFLPS